MGELITKLIMNPKVTGAVIPPATLNKITKSIGTAIINAVLK